MHASLQWADLGLLVLCLGVAVGIPMLLFAVYGRRDEAAVLPARQGEQEHPCRKCRNFDLDAGQKALRSSTVFTKVMAHVPPYELGHKVVTVHEGQSNEKVEITPSGPQSADWTEFGACVLHNEVVWAGYHCGDFVPLPMLRRLRKAS